MDRSIDLVRELVEQGKLWSHKDEKGDVRFYLELKDVESHEEEKT